MNGGFDDVDDDAKKLLAISQDARPAIITASEFKAKMRSSEGQGVHFMEGEGDKQQERARNRTETYFVIAAVVFFNLRGRAWMSRRIIHVTCAHICLYASFLLVTAPELAPT